MVLHDCHVHVIGLGLMGASLQMALRGKVAHRSGSDINPTVEKHAIEDEVVDSIGGMENADIVVIAIPADYIVELLPSLTLKVGALVVDMGSTKSQICQQMDTLPESVLAVGGHPMCGLAENGYGNALMTLYANSRFILCETTRTNALAQSLSEQLVAAIGAIPLWMSADLHDRTAGAISHLPHLMSFALMRLAIEMSADNRYVYELAAGGFDGATRLARTDETMITGMFRTNAAELRKLASEFQAHLEAIITLLDNPEALRAELDQIVAARRDYTHHYGERMIT